MFQIIVGFTTRESVEKKKKRERKRERKGKKSNRANFYDYPRYMLADNSVSIPRSALKEGKDLEIPSEQSREIIFLKGKKKGGNEEKGLNT